jgi:hypothetical protein
MKHLFSFLFLILALISCKPKKNPLLEQVDLKNYKSVLEKAYADSSDKTNKIILEKFISDFNSGATMTSPYQGCGGSYLDILKNMAIPYDDFRKKEKEFNDKVAKIAEIKLVGKKVSDTELVFELTNKGQVEIAGCDFSIIIKNQSNDVIYDLAGQKWTVKTPAGSTKKQQIYASSSERVMSMDLKLLTTEITFNIIDFADGTTIKHPWSAMSN